MTKVQEMRVRVAEAQRAKLNRKMVKAEKYINRLMENIIPKAADKGKTSIKVKVPMGIRPTLVTKYLLNEGFTVDLLQMDFFRRVSIKISWDI